MDQVEDFPFSTGQRVESKSNIKGFRGAWFRSEIKNIQIRRGEIWCAMHYIDFPDEKTNFMKAYQQDPSGKKKRVLMVRPSFPVLLMGVDESIIKDAAGPVVVVNGNWWVGDLVDWFTDGCFWAAKITAVLNKEFVQVELPSAPLGEGGKYEAAVKDIRPSLDWSMDKFWTVPTVKLCPPTLMDKSVSGPVKDLEGQHIFMGKQEDPGRAPFVNNALAGLTSESEKATNNTITSSHHALTTVGIVPEQFPSRESIVVTLDMQKDKKCALLVDNQGRVFPNASKPPDKVQLQPYRTSEQGLGQTQEVANQVHVRETDGVEAMPQTNADDLDGKVGFEKNSLGKSALNDTLSFEELNALLGDGKLLDPCDERIGSSIVALEELISRIAWLKGVMHLGLKGWCKERRKRKWAFCEREGLLPSPKSENDGPT